MKSQRPAQGAASARAGGAPEPAMMEAQNELGNAGILEMIRAGRVPSSMESAFGADFSDVRVHQDATGVQGWTEGRDVHIAPGLDPSRGEGATVLAHELAHVLQQRSGSARGTGFNGDAGLEADAQAKGEKVAAGGTVSAPGAKGSTPSQGPRQNYTEQSSEHGDLRVSEDAKMAVVVGYPNHKLWTEPGMISNADAKLKANGSVVSLKAGSETIQTTAPDGKTKRTLVEVLPSNSRTKTEGDDMQHYADCGRSTRDVVGAGGERWGTMRARFKEGRKNRETAAGHRPGEWKAEIFDRIGGEEAYKRLSPEKQREFDKKSKINDFADPAVGEGFTMSSGGAPIKGYEKNTWNFHFAGMIMKSGGDYVSLENFSVSQPDVSNTDWTFDMYGPAHKEGQTFHDQHTATKQHGETPTTMAIKKAL